MGKGGSVAVILMVFMAVTSSFSAEIIAHASIVTFDIYQPYIKPTASDKQLELVSHLSLTGIAIFSASFATALNASSILMGWILEFVGVVLGAAIIPITLAITNAHVSSLYMIVAALLGTLCGLAAWLGTTKGLYGEINLTTTFEN
jgi:Na+/proline symporter